LSVRGHRSIFSVASQQLARRLLTVLLGKCSAPKQAVSVALEDSRAELVCIIRQIVVVAIVSHSSECAAALRQ
jgi:hypothetical protein